MQSTMGKLRKTPAAGDIESISNRFPSFPKHTDFIDKDLKSAFNVVAMEFKESLMKEIKKSLANSSSK